MLATAVQWSIVVLSSLNRHAPSPPWEKEPLKDSLNGKLVLAYLAC